MREANRLIRTEGPSSQIARQISSCKAPDSNTQMHKFRCSSADLQIVPCSTRPRADQLGSERDLQFSSIINSAADSSDAATTNHTLHGLLGMEVDGAPNIKEPNMSFGYQASPGVISTANNVLSEMGSPTTEPASSLMGAMFLASQDLQSTIGAELLDPFHTLPLAQSRRTQRLMHHCKSS
jgi:hypothetical protein